MRYLILPLLIAGLALPACQTTRTLDDGTVVEEYDAESTRAILTLALEAAQRALMVYRETHAWRAEIDAAEYERQLREREQRVETLRELIAALPAE